MTPSDVTGPLANFQQTLFQKDDVLKLVKTINNLQDHKVSETVINASFEKFWPDLEQDIGQILSLRKEAKSSNRKDRDLLEELLERVRFITNHPSLASTPSKDGRLPLRVLERLEEGYSFLRTLGDTNDDFKFAYEILSHPVEYILQWSGFPGSFHIPHAMRD